MLLMILSFFILLSNDNIYILNSDEFLKLIILMISQLIRQVKGILVEKYSLRLEFHWPMMPWALAREERQSFLLLIRCSDGLPVTEGYFYSFVESSNLNIILHITSLNGSMNLMAD